MQTDCCHLVITCSIKAQVLRLAADFKISFFFFNSHLRLGVQIAISNGEGKEVAGKKKKKEFMKEELVTTFIIVGGKAGEPERNVGALN